MDGIDLNALLQIIILTAIAIVGWYMRRLVSTIDTLKQNLIDLKNEIVQLEHTKVSREDVDKQSTALQVYIDKNINASIEARAKMWQEINKVKERVAVLETRVDGK